MPQFKFNTISRADIERSKGGNVMLKAVDYDGGDNILITGVPGSGKTTVTIMRAERLINQNKKVAVFTYQNLLGHALQGTASKNLAPHIHGFYHWYVRVRGLGFLPDSHSEADMINKMGDKPIFHEVLIDEGQDFEERIFRSLLPQCLQMTVGADNAQKVHSRGIRSSVIGQELEKKHQTVHFNLEYNYRNTYEIYNFARFFMPDSERVNIPINLDLIPKGNGNIPIVIRSRTNEENLSRLKVILEDSGDRNIAVLLFGKDEVDNYYNKIIQMGYSATKWHSGNQPLSIENILVTTYKSAKGLEFQVVIMPEMHNALNTENKTPEHYYIGCTRAREELYLTFIGDKNPEFFGQFDENSFELRFK